ncbi:hypothetical protein [Rhodococcus globerulus]|uniref:hypothetical protein n=1 Tax=Rhodococcus globerulus TaxID=33008 RepID=UPI001C55B3F4|nr:hypothetical protein [Rhodococcus globerulus]QXW04043.1 hypothetical protein KYT97_08490 [Rhodococcus globerulus]
MSFHRNGHQATDIHVDKLRKRVHFNFLRFNDDTGEWDLVFCESHALADVQADFAEAS